jgi:hypothetical protein
MNVDEQKDWKEEFQKLINEKVEKTALTIAYRTVHKKNCINAYLDIAHLDASVGFSSIKIKCTPSISNILAHQKVAELACEIIRTEKFSFTVEKKGQVDIPRKVLLDLGPRRIKEKINAYRKSKGIREIIRLNDTTSGSPLSIRGEPNAVDLL